MNCAGALGFWPGSLTKWHNHEWCLTLVGHISESLIEVTASDYFFQYQYETPNLPHPQQFWLKWSLPGTYNCKVPPAGSQHEELLL